MLTTNDIKEELSYAYMHAIAAKIGYRCVRPVPDRDSIDVQVQGYGFLGAEAVLHSPMIQFQMKATSSPLTKVGDNYSFNGLKVKNYNDLRAKSAVPRLMAVLMMPEKDDQWVDCDVNRLILNKCVYWCNLYQQPAITTDTTTVYLHETNILSPEVLKALMEQAAKDEDLPYVF